MLTNIYIIVLVLLVLIYCKYEYNKYKKLVLIEIQIISYNNFKDKNHLKIVYKDLQHYSKFTLLNKSYIKYLRHLIMERYEWDVYVKPIEEKNI